MESFWPKKLSHWWNKILLSLSSQIDSNILQLLGIPGGILVSPVTRILGQNDSIFYFSVELA